MVNVLYITKDLTFLCEVDENSVQGHLHAYRP